jgi:hypothetical protein
VVVLLVTLLCYCRLRRRGGSTQKQSSPVPPHTYDPQHVASTFQQPNHGNSTAAQSSFGTSAVGAEKPYQGLHANVQPAGMTNSSMGYQSSPQYGPMQQFQGTGGGVIDGAPTNMHATVASAASAPSTMHAQTMGSTQSSYMTTGGNNARKGPEVQLANVYQAGFPTQQGNTTFASTAAGDLQQAPGPGATSECKQEYLQYQIDTLGAAEVLDGLVLQQGLRSRLLGGEHFSCMRSIPEQTIFRH